MKRALAVFLIFFSVCLGYAQNSVVADEARRLMAVWEFDKAEETVKNGIFSSNAPDPALIALLAEIYRTSGNPTGWNDFIKRAISERPGNPSFLNAVLRADLSESTPAEGSELLEFMIEKNIRLFPDNINRAGPFLTGEKVRPKITDALKKSIASNTVPTDIRISYLGFLPKDQAEKLFGHFDQNDPLFKGYMLTFYYGENREKYDALLESSRRDNFQKKCIYARFIFSLGEYASVIDLIKDGLSSGRPQHEAYEMVISAQIILGLFEDAADTLFLPNYTAYRSMTMSDLEQRFVNPALFSIITKRFLSGKYPEISESELTRLAFLSGEKALFKEIMDRNFSLKKNFTQILWGGMRGEKWNGYYDALVEYFIGAEVFREKEINETAVFLETRFPGKSLLALECARLLAGHSEKYADMYHYYALLYGHLPVTQAIPADPTGSYGLYLKQARDFYARDFGKISQAFPLRDLYVIDALLKKEEIKKEDIIAVTTMNPVLPVMSILRYFAYIFDEGAKERIRDALYDFARAFCLNEAPASAINDEYGLMTAVYYYKKLGDQKKVNELLEKHAGLLNIFAGLAEDLRK